MLEMPCKCTWFFVCDACLGFTKLFGKILTHAPVTLGSVSSSVGNNHGLTRNAGGTYLDRYPHTHDPLSSEIIDVGLDWGGLVHEVRRAGEDAGRKLPS